MRGAAIPARESKPYQRVPAAPRRLEHWLWQVSGLIADPSYWVVRVAFPDVSSGHDASVAEDAESPLRGSHGFTPCSLFSRPSCGPVGHQQPTHAVPVVSTVATVIRAVKAESVARPPAI
jgi:hypothetical protein